MFEETSHGDLLEVGVIVEADGNEVSGTFTGPASGRLEVVARAALAAAGKASTQSNQGDFVGVESGQIGDFKYVTVLIHDVAAAEPLVGSAILRPYEDDGKATIRAVFSAVNRRFDL